MPGRAQLRIPALALGAALIAFAACKKDDETNCSGPPPPIGAGFAPGDPPEIQIAMRTTNGAVEVVTEDHAVPIIIAPQGGFIILPSVRARNMGECLNITAAIRDESAGNQIVALEERPVQVTTVGLSTDGWLSPFLPNELFNWANIAACPNAALQRDLDGGRWLLEITARNDRGAQISASVHILPYCTEPLQYCRASCTVGTSGVL